MAKENYIRHHVGTMSGLTKLLEKHGYEGVGIYWALRESMGNSAKSYDDMKAICLSMGMDWEVAKDVLYNFGFFEIDGDMLSYPDNVLEVSADETVPMERVKAFVAAYNAMEGVCRCTKITEKRKTKIRARLAEMGSDDVVKELFAKFAHSSFLKGRNDRGWRADLDWLVENDTNWVKVYEGRYADRDAGEAKKMDNKSVNSIWQ